MLQKGWQGPQVNVMAWKVQFDLHFAPVAVRKEEERLLGSTDELTRVGVYIMEIPGNGDWADHGREVEDIEGTRYELLFDGGVPEVLHLVVSSPREVLRYLSPSAKEKENEKKVGVIPTTVTRVNGQMKVRLFPRSL